MELLLLFILLNIVNVVLQTAKSIITVKCGKIAAALINAIAYGVYTIVIIYLNCDLTLLTKVLIVAITNFIGVYIVKLFEAKVHKDRLWKIEFTTPKELNLTIQRTLIGKKISFNTINIDNYVIFNCYCKTQKESLEVKKVINYNSVKYFVSESKTL